MAERRPWLGAAVVGLVAVTSWWTYNHSPAAVAEIVILPYAIALILGPSVAYVWARRNGARWRVACALALMTPLSWLLKELYRVTAVFSFGEAAYYALNPISFGVFTAAATQMALAELAIRPAGRRFTTGPVATLVAVGLLAVASAIAGATSGGREIFYGYIAIYRVLFPAS